MTFSRSFFFSSRRRHTRLQGDWSSDVCSSDLGSRATRSPRARPGGSGPSGRRSGPPSSSGPESRVCTPPPPRSPTAPHCGIERVLVGTVVPGREYDCDSLIVHLLGRFVDRILGIERTAGAPGIVHHLDVVSLLMVQNVVEARERPEDEQDVAGTEADELLA